MQECQCGPARTPSADRGRQWTVTTPTVPDRPPDWHAALLTPEGRALVESLTPYDPRQALDAVARARRDPTWAGRPDVVAAAATQAQARTRAASRFPGAPRWWTLASLEQATRPVVAGMHARRYVDAGVTHVLDLCCGAGSDALAMSAAGMHVTAVDRDPDALWALTATALDAGVAVRTVRGDVLADADPLLAGLGPSGGCYVDPARRTQGSRAMHPESWAPPWSWVRDLAGRFPVTGAKAAPGIPHDAIPTGAQVEWVSVAGTLVEAGVWWGPLRRGPARRVATMALEGGTSRSMDDASGIPPAPVGPVGRWLLEPDPALIRAGLVSLLATQLSGRLLDPRIAYVTTDRDPPATPWGTRYEVLEEVPVARRAMRAWLRARGFRDVIVKKRGLDIVPEHVRSQMRLAGGGPTALLVLTRTDRGPVGWSVRRV